MQVLLAMDLPVASSCGGKGVCAKCRIKVRERPSTVPLPGPTDLEKRLLAKLSSEHEDRISCQVKLNGGEVLEVDADYW